MSESSTNLPLSESRVDWRTIAALNGVSALAQVGQFGIAELVMPIWLANQGLDASQLGLYEASVWLGVIPGLLFAPWLSQNFGPQRIILVALLCSILAFLSMPFAGWPLYLLTGSLTGIGLGLRWIGLEPWLYHIAPSGARGRLVGFHETLLGLAPIVAMALSNYFGVATNAPLYIGAAFTFLALIPLFLAHPENHGHVPRDDSNSGSAQQSSRTEIVFVLGIGVAFIGGTSESALFGLFPKFGEIRLFKPDEMASLMTVYGIGGFLLQYLTGWLADHKGLKITSLLCAIGTLACCITLAASMNPILVNISMFLLGGFITSYLTLALIAGAITRSGTLAHNLRAISITYTVSGVIGPVITGWTVTMFGGMALMWSLGIMSALMVFFSFQSERFLKKPSTPL